MPQIPAEAMAALQQQQAGSTDITSILAQLAEMSPDEVAAALQQLGIQVDPNTLHDAAAQWVENAGDKQASSGAGSEDEVASEPQSTDDEAATPAPTPPTGDDEAAEGAPDDEYAEGEGASDDAEGGQGAASAGYTPRAGGASRGGAPNTAIAGRRGGGMNMDALISAALSQGDPNSMPPPVRPPGAGASRGAMPPTAPTAAGEDPRARAMIASIYRDATSKPQRSARAASRANNIPPPVAAGRRR